MPTFHTYCLFFAPFALSLGGCSSQPDVRSHLGDGNEGHPRSIGESESFFIAVRGDEFERGDIGSDLVATNVFVEIGADHVVYSKRYILFWTEDVIPEMEISTVDRKKISEENYKAIRQRLSHYLPSAHSNKDMVLTPKGCSVPLHSVSQASVTFGTRFREAHGAFVFPRECTTSSGKVVRDDLNAILKSLPPLEGLGGYQIE
ncbi:hypothetical protein [Croceicoccus mobilis]|uniref:hypothetical protein n=1 Tax=Croceicoccus mobilis TaxID=1703339 RepID=UPI000A6CE155|nr:hypothetical protein [Croceicoccus mobilis]